MSFGQNTSESSSLKDNILHGSVLWSIDLNEWSDNLIHRTESFLTAFIGKEHLPVQAVFVADHEDKKDLASEHHHFIEMQPSLEKVNLFLKTTKLNIQTKIQELEATSRHMRDRVDVLIDFARVSQALFIVVGNRGNSGLKRLFAGSFSETLIARSPIPVLVIGSHSQIESSIKKILVPTHFTDRDHKIFLKAVEYAHKLNASIDLYHCVPDELNSNLDLTGLGRYDVNGKTVNFFDYRKIKIEDKQKEGSRWVKESLIRGVDARFKVEVVPEDNEMFLDQAVSDLKPDLIILETSSSSLKALTFGSVAKHLAREASCPVLIYSSNYFTT